MTNERCKLKEDNLTASRLLPDLGKPQHVADGHNAKENRPGRNGSNDCEGCKLHHIIATQLGADVTAEFIESRKVSA